MIINKDYEIEYSDEFNQLLCEFAIKAGEEIKDLTPMERFYAMKLISERIETLTSVYVMVGQLGMQQFLKEEDETFDKNSI